MDSQQETKQNPPFATVSGMPSFNREQARQERDDLELMKNLQLFTELVQQDGSTVFDVEGVLVDAPTGCQLALRKRPQQLKNNERIPLIREYARRRAKADACDGQTFGPTRFERSSSDRILISGEKNHRDHSVVPYSDDTRHESRSASQVVSEYYTSSGIAWIDSLEGEQFRFDHRHVSDQLACFPNQDACCLWFR